MSGSTPERELPPLVLAKGRSSLCVVVRRGVVVLDIIGPPIELDARDTAAIARWLAVMTRHLPPCQ